MSPTLFLDEARALAGACIARDQARYGGNADDARDRVARRIGWAPGTLYNLMRDRLKRLDFDLRQRLTEYAIDDLRKEINALTRELDNAYRLGREPNAALADKAQGVLDEARALHARLVRGE